MVTFCISLLNRLIHDIKKINYIKESRVKTSTVCISWLFPNCPFCLQQSQIFSAQKRESFYFLQKKVVLFFLLLHLFVISNRLLKKNKMYQQMQREKLYTLRKKCLFHICMFCVHNEQNCVRQVFDDRIKIVLVYDEFIFLLLQLLNHIKSYN